MNLSSRLKPLLDALEQPALCLDPDGSFAALNPAAEKLLRCSAADVVGRTWTNAPWITVDRNERRVEREGLPGERILRTGQSTPKVLLGLKVGSEHPTIWVNASAVPLPGSSERDPGAALVLLEPMVAVAGPHPAAGELDRISQLPPEQRQFRKRTDEASPYRALFEHNKSVMLIVHPCTGRILDANPSACEYYGYPRETLVRMRIQQINTLSDVQVQEQMGRARARKSGRFRFRHRLASGEIRDVEVSSSPVPIGGEEVLHSIVHDVTQRERAERQIRERNWELRLINSVITSAMQGTAPVGLLHSVCCQLGEHMTAEEVLAVVLDARKGPGATIAAGCVRGQAARAVGARLPADVSTLLYGRIATGKAWYVPDWRREAALRGFGEHLATAPSAMLLLPFAGKDEDDPRGAMVLCASDPRRLHDPEAQTIGHRLSNQVARALTIARNEQVRRRLLAAIEQSSDMVAVMDVNGALVYSNAAFDAATGRQPEWDADQRFPELMDVPELHEAWTTVASGRQWTASFGLRRVDGSRIDADAVVSPVRDDAGKIVNVIAVIRDVTRETQLQQQVQHALKMEGIGRLAGGLAHDFNNTLAAIMGYAGLVRARLAPDHPAYNDVLEIQETILRASNLSRQLLTFARRPSTEPRPVDVNTIILNLDRMLRRLIGEDIELVTAPAPSLYRTVVELGQIEQVIVNVVVNARDAMPDGGKIVIETANEHRDAGSLAARGSVEAGDYVHLSIKDNGVGMPEEVQQHVFEPFFTTKSPDQGTGLGLATCFGIVGHCGGFIEIESEVGLGTTVHVYLPATSERDSHPPSERAPAAVPQGDETVLVAEDDPVVRRMAVRLLEKNGYRVLQASNGEEALRLAQRHDGNIHALLTDVIMPRMGARELIEEIKKDRPGIKVMIMSGYADDPQLRERADAQHIPFLGKPFTELALLYKLRDLLDN